jgi:hypothetical protein
MPYGNCRPVPGVTWQPYGAATQLFSGGTVVLSRCSVV